MPPASAPPSAPGPLVEPLEARRFLSAAADVGAAICIAWINPSQGGDVDVGGDVTDGGPDEQPLTDDADPAASDDGGAGDVEDVGDIEDLGDVGDPGDVVTFEDFAYFTADESAGGEAGWVVDDVPVDPGEWGEVVCYALPPAAGGGDDAPWVGGEVKAEDAEPDVTILTAAEEPTAEPADDTLVDPLPSGAVDETAAATDVVPLPPELVDPPAAYEGGAPEAAPPLDEAVEVGVCYFGTPAGTDDVAVPDAAPESAPDAVLASVTDAAPVDAVAVAAPDATEVAAADHGPAPSAVPATSVRQAVNDRSPFASPTSPSIADAIFGRSDKDRFDV
ncbi:MAG TPA: hypothetical protein VF796_00635 [Humisphaera sp.]